VVPCLRSSGRLLQGGWVGAGASTLVSTRFQGGLCGGMPWLPCSHSFRAVFTPSPTQPHLHPMYLQLGEMWGGPKTEDTEYVRVKAMLKSLDLAVSTCWGCGGQDG